jgi:hypothetical protein
VSRETYRESARDPASETVTYHVVEARLDDQSWVPAETTDHNADDAEAAYQHWLDARGSLEVRLVKRTAVITSEVISSGRQESR